MTSLRALRHELHSHPELSGDEAATSDRLQRFFLPLAPDDILTGLGGHGLAVSFGSPDNGPTVMLRCELDALPIPEANRFAHRSRNKGVSHKCGHDGHMAILAAVGQQFARRRPANGRVVLLFQPAEETGAGAALVAADQEFRKVRPDRIFALHNVPGYPLGYVIVRNGTFTCASRGMAIELRGRHAHAAEPHTGVSPAAAMANIVEFLGNIDSTDGNADLSFVTVVGARLGERSFGVAPADAEVWATLRTATDAGMDALVATCESHARGIAARHELNIEFGYVDVFDATINSDSAVDAVRRASAPLAIIEPQQPFRWSEDFGRFTQLADGALFAIGSGTDTPALHNDEYDFPDELIEIGAALFRRIVDESLREMRDLRAQNS